MSSPLDQSARAAGERVAPGAASPYLNRELSWLDFDSRVLALAEDPARPLLERVRFLAISASNLDEFFQVRVAGLKAQEEARVAVASPDGLTPAQQLAAIREQVLRLTARQYDLYSKQLLPELASAGIQICRWNELDEQDAAALSRLFDEQIFPVLTPLSVDPAHPFPFISNLSLNLAVVVRNAGNGEQRFARVKVPPVFPRFLPLRDQRRFVPLEEVVSAHLAALFPGAEIVHESPFRVTRDADLALEEDEADDLLEAIRHGLRRRQRESAGVRLEVSDATTPQVQNLLAAELEIEASDVYRCNGPLDLGALSAIAELARPDLRDEAPHTYTQVALRAAGGSPPDLFEVLKQGSVLVHHPYDSFATSVEALLAQAADDPNVLAIKHTLYRTSGERSPIVQNLIRAAEAGKQVVTLVELKARFDEQANIAWARALEEAGVHVVYGLVDLKTHAKIALVVRQEEGRIRRYCHVATGNYNPVTARLYEDIGILSSDEDLGADLTQLFNYLTGCAQQPAYERLVVAPERLRSSILELIRGQIRADDGRIAIKVNSLADPEVIDALYAASQAGVEIDLIVRGICCLRPGVPGLSDRIRVRSIVGRFLEHSRIFRFGNPRHGARYLVGSADLMPRNLDRRVEVMVEVREAALTARLDEILRVNLADDVLAWQLGSDTVWRRVERRHGVDTHRRLLELARARAGEAGAGGEDVLGA
jgi:polyphosphate kinase